VLTAHKDQQVRKESRVYKVLTAQTELMGPPELQERQELMAMMERPVPLAATERMGPPELQGPQVLAVLTVTTGLSEPLALTALTARLELRV
jgi:hypothetical protein